MHFICVLYAFYMHFLKMHAFLRKVHVFFPKTHAFLKSAYKMHIEYIPNVVQIICIYRRKIMRLMKRDHTLAQKPVSNNYELYIV